MKCFFSISFCLLIQESAKAKHPQTLHELKFYKIVQGRSNVLSY